MPPVIPAGTLLGRENETALLTGLLRELSRGRGSSVLIEGEPGIGKSALVRAAMTGVPDVGCQMFWGAGDELSQALPLLPFLDGLRVREPSPNPRTPVSPAPVRSRRRVAASRFRPSPPAA